MIAPNPPTAKVLGLLQRVQSAGNGWTAQCPAHDDHKNSLSIGNADNGGVVLRCHAGCKNPDVCSKLGISLSDLFATAQQRPQPAPNYAKRRIVKTYDYCDENSDLLFQTVRFEPKGFSQRRPDGKGDWIWNLQGMRRVLYRLPEIAASDPDALVWITEGEKDADRLAALGLVATTAPLGAGKWTDDYAVQIGGRPVAILPDHDMPGSDHAEAVAASTARHGSEARIVALSDLPAKGDVSDWLDAGGSLDLLHALYTSTSIWKPPTHSTGRDTESSDIGKPEPFPLDALPRIAKRFVDIGARARGVPPEFVAVPLLAFTGAVIGTGIVLQIKGGWIEYPVLWVGVVGKPGTGKSPAQDYAGVPVRAVQQSLFEAWRKDMDAFEALPPLERKTILPPKLKSVFTTDATIEAVTDMLGRRNGLAIEREEVAGWTASFDAYKKGGDRQLFLSSWAVAPWKVDRKSTGSIYIPRPIVCIAGGIQPDRLPDLRGGTVDDGFPDRFLLSYPECEPIGYTDTEDDGATIAALTDVFTRLYRFAAGTTVVTMTPQAHALFRSFVDRNAETLRTATGLAAGWGSKAPRHLARIALILHALGQDDPSNSLTVSTMDAAIQATEYFRSHFLRCLSHMGASGSSEPAGDVPRVRRYLLEAGGLWLPRSELMQKTRLAAPRLTGALFELESRGEAECRRVNTGSHEREDWRIVARHGSGDSGHSEHREFDSVELPESSELSEPIRSTEVPTDATMEEGEL